MMTLGFREETIELHGRVFTLREMSAEKQDKFYGLIMQMDRHQKRFEELNAKGQGDGLPAADARGQVRALNGQIWLMMLNPADNMDPPTLEWLEANTNNRIAELVCQKQFTLNDFEGTLGKLAARQQQALGTQQRPSDGLTVAAPLAESTT